MDDPRLISERDAPLDVLYRVTNPGKARRIFRPAMTRNTGPRHSAPYSRILLQKLEEENDSSSDRDSESSPGASPCFAMGKGKALLMGTTESLKTMREFGRSPFSKRRHHNAVDDDDNMPSDDDAYDSPAHSPCPKSEKGKAPLRPVEIEKVPKGAISGFEPRLSTYEPPQPITPILTRRICGANMTTPSRLSSRPLASDLLGPRTPRTPSLVK